MDFNPPEVHPPGDLQPAIARHLVVANEVAGTLGKDFGPSPGATVHSRFPESLDGLIDGHLGPAGKEIELNHGEGLEMNLGEALLQAAEQVGVVGEGKIGMEAAHDVKLGHRLAIPHGGVMIGLLQRHGVATLAGFAGETAELAVNHADVGGVQVAVDVEIPDVPVPFFPDPVGQSPHRMQVRSPIESDSLFERQSLP